jgi:hypothetical protein
MTTETDQNQERREEEERERVYLLDLTFFLSLRRRWMMPIAPALPRPRCNNYTRTDVKKVGGEGAINLTTPARSAVGVGALFFLIRAS